ncbi:MlaC/ttg2D family ABC transporter substrate-binding protein [Campylobacter geochelonis]|uniref:Toluene tolerance protein Ttg2D n=1 Tax=Campylobacter geochelonis TaxID=1780362 RepID=A0A128EK06_9BACT|nr:ABC transporter substrate-binding protein [Campylobacter geochelonis]QKF71992.1 lipid asymmetry ABC transporter MlaABCDEF, periplasmic component MlaC [Campylobacter geochelonis]CZE47727.1 toluene tolerance protein Ttg2D [Campylobacter geochelonis]CZE48957.1 toluene tolerance protein Ttg2D [Campylobacter geochelonis]CZE49924.1 toluene tolerance protein Ttg2D [Campylobacter geochelonis]
MKFIQILSALALVFNLAFGLSKDQIQSVMTQKVAMAVDILKDKNIDKQAKPSKIFALFDEYLDYSLMSRLSLSNYYKTLSKEQQAQFNKAYENRLKKSFIASLEEYSDQDMKVVGAHMPSPKRFNLDTQIIGSEKNYPINFKFYPKTSDEWLIYDVDVLGVSIIQTYRSQFDDLTKRGVGFDEILQRLENTDFNANTKK